MTSGARHLKVRTGGTTEALWRAAQYIALGVLIVLLVGMVVRPDLSLLILWNVLIPLVPASLLISPVVWRGVCPLATLNMSTNGLIGQKRVDEKLIRYSGLVGVGLLFLLVPARRFVFNENALVLAMVVVAVGALALLTGAIFDAKAGFCSTLCPVLPVERLYGQRPLVTLDNPRCPTCTRCTSRGCIDLSPTKSIPQILGRDRRSVRWLTSGFGVFAASFPGFIVGYFTTTNTTIDAAAHVYLNVLAWSVTSYLVFTAIIRFGLISTPNATVFLAGVSAGFYYWFAAPGISDALGRSDNLSTGIRVIALVLVATWLAKGNTGIGGTTRKSAMNIKRRGSTKPDTAG